MAHNQTPRWSFLTPHAHVLLTVARNPGTRTGEIAANCHIGERTVQRIAHDLEARGYLTRERVGRTTQYTVPSNVLCRHSAQYGPIAGVLVEKVTSGG